MPRGSAVSLMTGDGDLLNKAACCFSDRTVLPVCVSMNAVGPLWWLSVSRTEKLQLKLFPFL